MDDQSTIRGYSVEVSKNIKDYYDNTRYVEFKTDVPSKTGEPSVIAKRTKFKLMTKTNEISLKNEQNIPIKMELFDENLYSLETATYNTSIYFAKKKKEEQEKIQLGYNNLIESEGLSVVMKTGYLDSVEDFIISKYAKTPQTESFVSGNETGGNPNEKNETNYLSFFGNIVNNVKDTINDTLWGKSSNINNSQVIEGLTSGLNFTSYNGYVDNWKYDSINGPVKSINNSEVYGISTNFNGINGATNSKITTETKYVMTKLNGYFYTDTLDKSRGEWSFKINSDDMSVLYLFDLSGSESLIFTIENRGLHGMKEKSGTVALNPNTYYKIIIATGNNDGPGNFRLSVKPPGKDWLISKKSTDNSKVETMDKYFYANIDLYKNIGFDSSQIKTVDNSDKLNKLYENAKTAAMNEVSSLGASSSVLNKTKTTSFLMVNPDVPDKLITVFPATPIKGKTLVKHGNFNSLDWAQLKKTTGIAEPTLYTIPVSAEWFGYFKAVVSGTYSIKIGSNRKHISNLWIGDKALVNYMSDNKDIYNNGGNVYTDIQIHALAGRYYPIRIQYSQSSSTNWFNFSVDIFKIESDGTKGGSVSNSVAYFCSLLDSKNEEYEPMQMAIALRNDRNTKTDNLYNCYISPVDVINNFKNNENLRKVRGQQCRVFKSLILTKDAISTTTPTLTLTANGDLVFNNGKSQRSITGTTLTDSAGSIQNTNCDNMCSLSDYNKRSTILFPGSTPVTDTNIYNLSVKENKDGSSEELLGNYVAITQSSGTDAETGAKYVDIKLYVNINNYEINNYNAAKKQNETLSSCYVFYSIGVNGEKKRAALSKTTDKKAFVIIISNKNESTEQMKQSQDSSGDALANYKKSYQSAIDIDATKCIESVNSQCNFYAGIDNNGNLFIRNRSTGSTIWSSGDKNRLYDNLEKEYINEIRSTDKLKPVIEWITNASALNNYYIYSASYANPFDTTKFLTTSIGKGQPFEVLYSPNGKYKLTLENGTLELKYALNGDLFDSLYTNNDGSDSFMLHLITADEKLGNVYLETIDKKSLYEMKNDKNKILKNDKTFYKSTADPIYQYPPYNTGSMALNTAKYDKTKKTKQECEASCANTDSCSHYYSYKTPANEEWCMMNTDNSPEQYYDKRFNSAGTPELNDSNLYIRNKMIDTTCTYSVRDKSNVYKKPTSTVITNTEVIKTYNNGYDIIYERSFPDGKTENPKTEGACGDPVIYTYLSNLIGTEKTVGDYKFNTDTGVEGFSPKSNITVEAFSDSGYKESNSCDLVKNYVSGTDGKIVNVDTIGSIINNCKTDILSNINAIETKWAEFNADNSKINNYYNDITKGTAKLKAKNDIINDPDNKQSAVNYDSIDYSGNLLRPDEFQESASLKDGRIKDERDNITNEITMYLVSIMALIAVFIFLIFLTSP